MNKLDLYRAVGEIDNRFIAEAINPARSKCRKAEQPAITEYHGEYPSERSKKRRAGFTKFIPAAACFLLLVLSAAYFIPMFTHVFQKASHTAYDPAQSVIMDAAMTERAASNSGSDYALEAPEESDKFYSGTYGQTPETISLPEISISGGASAVDKRENGRVCAVSPSALFRSMSSFDLLPRNIFDVFS
ncbi:MAG: hypothetical protein LBC78_02850 [Oscillospiraceae bacterium]|jgi:hypothetical protein|nr:hypothetical protein [Oscillospiraceae bacterium]